MENLKKELLFSIVIVEHNKGELSYQVNPDVTVGIDPRNEVIIVGPHVSAKHLYFTDKDGELLLEYLGENEVTFLNNKPLYKNQKYFLRPADIIKVDQTTIRIKKELAFRHQKQVNLQSIATENIASLKIKNTNEELKIKSGLNFKPKEEDFTSTIIADEKMILKKDFSSTLFSNKSMKSEKKKKNLFSREKLLQLFLGIFLDFFLSYFLLSVFDNLKIHLFIFFVIQEVLCIFIFKHSFFQKILSYKFHRQFTVWILLILFIVYPFTKNTFNQMVTKSTFDKSTIIDLHGEKWESESQVNGVSLVANVDQKLFLIPTLIDNKLSFNFYNNLNKKKLNIQVNSVYNIDHLINYFYRTSPFKIPTKKDDPVTELKLFVGQSIYLNQTEFKKLILKNGPFLSAVNDSKAFFLSGLKGKIEEVILPEKAPVLIFRDHDQAKVFILGKTNLYLLTYNRHENYELENLFIEKILANIQSALIKKLTNKIGFLEMFDSLPSINYQTLYTLIEQDLHRSPVANWYDLKSEYEQNIEQIILEINKESRKVDPVLIKQFNELKNKFAKKNF